MMLIKIWDILVWLTVLFPFLTGGIWLRTEKIFIEFTQITIPVVILTIFSLFLHFHKKNSLQSASSVKIFLKIWNFWLKSLAQAQVKILSYSMVGIGLLWFCCSLRRHYAFASGAADLGIFTNALWNLSHGNGYFSSVKGGVNLFSDHQSSILWLIAPLFYFVPKIETLFFIQSFALASGAVALFLFSKKFLTNHKDLLATIPWIYWFYLPIRNANAFDFHPEVLMSPLFLWAMFFIFEKKFRFIGILFFLLALSTKESAAPVLIGITITIFISTLGNDKFIKSIAVILLFFSLMLFYFNLKFVPAYFHAQYAYGSVYNEFLQNPLAFIPQFFDKARIKFLWETLMPLGFLPLLCWRAWPAFLPGYLMLFLTSGDQRISTGFHYAIEPAVGLFLALPMAMHTVLKKHSQKILLLWICFFTLLGISRSDIFRIRWFAPTPYQTWLRKDIIPNINPQASVAASNALVPHLSTRYWIHYLPNIKTNENKYVDCVIRDPAVNNWPMGEDDVQRLLIELKQNYQLVYHCHSLEIWQKSNNRVSCFHLICV